MAEETEIDLIAFEQSEQISQTSEVDAAEPVQLAQAGGVIPPPPGFPSDEPVNTGISTMARLGGLGVAGGMALSTRGVDNEDFLLDDIAFVVNTPALAFTTADPVFADTVTITAQSIELSHVSAQYSTATELAENAKSVVLMAGSIQVVDFMQPEPTGIYADMVSITATSESVASFIEVFANSGSITTATNIGANDTVLVGNLVGQQQMLSIDLGGGTADSVSFSAVSSSAIDLDKSTVVDGIVTLVLDDGANVVDTYVLANVESFVFSDTTFGSTSQLADFIANVI